MYEDGRKQTIRYFSRESDLPLTLGLMVDTSMSQQRVIDAERGARVEKLWHAAELPPEWLELARAAIAVLRDARGRNWTPAHCRFQIVERFMSQCGAVVAKLDGFRDLTGLAGRVVHRADEIPAALDEAMADPAPAGLLDALQRRLDGHFDRLAELALAGRGLTLA